MDPVSCLLGAWALGCAASDLARRRIPNPLTGGALLVGGGVCAATGATALGCPWAPAVLAAAGVAAALVLLFAAGIVGAGDVKLLVAMALLTGPVAIVPTLLAGSVLAGGWALVSLRVAPWAALASPLLARAGWGGDRAPATSLPLAVPYAAAFVATLWRLAEGVA